MLRQVTGNSLQIRCNDCEHIFNVNVKKELVFLEDFGQYENISAQCPKCNTVEIFNMNLPEEEINVVTTQNENDEAIFSEDEVLQRQLIGELIEKLINKGVAGQNE